MFLSTEDHNEKVLSHVNLEVKPGDYICTCRYIRCRKDYLLQSDPRFYDVSRSAIIWMEKISERSN